MTDAPSEPLVSEPARAVGLRSERGPVLLAIMVATGLVAIDATVLATAVPTIVRELGGAAQFPWLFSAYLLTQAVTVPVYARLADIFGRKPMMLFGIGLFLLGSVLCGLAWSMPALIAFRAVQGLGAGAVQPMSMTILGDIYTVAERARVQGYVAGVWAGASVIGPTLGGALAQLGVWRLIFYVNVPLCLVAGGLIMRSLHERVERREHRIDYLGTTLLTAGLALVILDILEGGNSWGWTSATAFAVGGAGLALLVAFVVVQRRVAEPVLPLWLLTRRLIASTSLVGLGIGAVLIGLTSFVPTYLEHSIGSAPLVAGFAVAALTLGWPISAALSGRLVYLRYGFRACALLGSVITVVGAAALAVAGPHPSVWAVATTCFVTGLGLGLMATPSVVAAQSSVEWDQRGVVTGLSMFARSIGSAVGAAVFGAVANHVVATSGRPASDPTAARHAGTTVFVAVLVTAVLVALAALAMPRESSHEPPS